MVNFLIVIFTCAFFFSDRVSGSCPPKELLSPCTCLDEKPGASINCVGNDSLSLKQIFWNVSKKSSAQDVRFRRLQLTNSKVDEIEKAAFGKVTFEHLFLNAKHLKKIHSKAFDGPINKTVVSLIIYNNSTKLATEPPTHDFFQAINSLSNLKDLHVYTTTIDSIPRSAFGLSQPSLQRVAFINHRIQSIGDSAFERLDNLNLLTLGGGPLKKLETNALVFKNSTNSKITVDFSNNKLTVESFANRTLANANRPISLMLWNNNVKYIDKQRFQPFLEKSVQNNVNMNSVDCRDCRSVWLIRLKNRHHNQTRGCYCDGSNMQQTIWDDKSFSNCR